MLRTYGVDVLDPAVTLRRVKVLTDRMPPGAWPDPHHALSWDTDAYLLAQLIDEIAAMHYLLARAYGGKPKRPKPFYRPGPKRPARRQPGAAARTSWGSLADKLMGQKSGVEVHTDG
jgi:hypothetical protein